MDPNSLFAVLLGGGFLAALVAFYKAKPERIEVVVSYQAEIITNLREENKRLVEKNRELENRVDHLETIVEKLERDYNGRT